MIIETLSGRRSRMTGGSRLDRGLWRISRRKRKAKLWASINTSRTGVRVAKTLMMKFQLSASCRWRQLGRHRIRERLR